MPRITIGPTFWNINATSIGAPIGGGFLICKAGGIGWIVSPYSTEVSRDWHSREDANTTAQSVSGCTGWFVPTISQLQNPGHVCRSFWGPSPCFSGTKYWSSTEADANCACTVRFGFPDGLGQAYGKGTTLQVRAFRCMTY
jgi:hypothetical protein